VALVAKRVFLHIGAPKSGTTYLQNTLAANRRVLKEQGLLYADGKFSRDRVWATEVLRGVDLSGHRRPQAAGAWDRIVSQVKEWDGDCVISHEFFGACTTEQAARALEDLAPSEVHLVFTARDYVRQCAAVWQERLKYGFAARFSDFRLETVSTPVWSWTTQDMVAILGRWQHSIPGEHVHVVTVPGTGGNPAELWQRFASVVGADADSCVAPPSGANTSLGLVEAELLRRVGEQLDGVVTERGDRARWIRDLLANKVLAAGSRERFVLSGDYAEQLADRSRQAASDIASAGYDVVGDIADLLPPDPLPTTRTPDDATESELLDAAVAAIAALVAEAKSSAVAASDKKATASSSGTAARPAPSKATARLRRLMRRVR
jgi:hypothetical protein